MKKALAVLLTLALLAAVAPAASAKLFDDGWRIYYTEGDETTFLAVVVAPAKYTRLSDTPQIETIYTTDHDERTVSTPAAEQIQYYSDGKTETRWTLTVSCEVPDESVPEYCFTFAVLAGSLLDDAGKGNDRVYFAEDDDYLSAEGYTEIDVYSRLLLHDYADIDDTAAVGDTVHLEYNGLYPVDIVLNGQTVASFPGGEHQKYTYSVTETGTLSFAVRQRGADLAARTLTIITSEEMYERNLQESMITGEDIPTIEDLTQPGVPIGNPFLPFAMIMVFFNNIGSFFHRLLSFIRITK